jgi:hypothetical protein
LLIRIAEGLKPVSETAFRKRVGQRFSETNNFASGSTVSLLGTAGGVRWSLDIATKWANQPDEYVKPEPCCVRLRTSLGASVELNITPLPAGGAAEALHKTLVADLPGKRSVIGLRVGDSIRTLKLVSRDTNIVVATAKTPWPWRTENWNAGAIVGPRVEPGKFRIDLYDSGDKLVTSVPVER